ncbi:MAG TPA: NADH-quinone oxidoreductase subunit N [Candidatus Kapabacteria bacterium]|jgi:NADH-quinone oxidoreductase subunit N
MNPQLDTLSKIAHAVQGYSAISLNNFVPELVLGIGFLAAILLDAITRRARSKQFAAFFAMAVLAVAAVFSILQWHAFDPLHAREWARSGSLVFPYSQLLFGPMLGTNSIVNGYAMIAVDNFTVFFKVLIAIGAILTLAISLTSRALQAEPQRIGEYSSLILGLSIGMFLMPASTDLVMMYLSLELTSIAGYILAGFHRKTEHGAEAALKYILFGALSSGLMIYGFSLFYGLTGTTNIRAISEIFRINPLTHSGTNLPIIWAAVILSLVGMGYKISAFPFHFWTPDVYEGAPVPITGLLSVASKAAGFGLLIRFLFFVLPPSGLSHTPIVPWPMVLAIGAFVTMTFGNIAALLQSNVRRMLAYSSIAHSGYMLAALATGTLQGVVAVLIYLAVYLFMQLGAFFAVLLIENSIGSEKVEDYRGLMLRAPMVCSALVIFLVSLTGIPVTAGFIGKFYLVSALVAPNSLHGVPLLWLAIALIVNSVLSLYYYLRVAAAMFLKRPLVAAALEELSIELPKPPRIRYSIPAMVLLFVFVIPVIALGLFFQPLVDLTSGVINAFLR